MKTLLMTPNKLSQQSLSQNITRKKYQIKTFALLMCHKIVYFIRINENVITNLFSLQHYRLTSTLTIKLPVDSGLYLEKTSFYLNLFADYFVTL